MENTYMKEAPDEPIDICLEHGGDSECSKWPDLYPKPCCWLSCTEICGAACDRNKKGYTCEYYGGEREDVSDAS